MKKINNYLINLYNIIPKERVKFDNSTKVLYSYDATNNEFSPDLVVFPLNVEEVKGIVDFAVTYNIPIVPRGAGSGMSGGALAVNGGIVISFEKMNKIKSVDKINLLAQVEPGVITGQFHRYLEKMNLFYPPDPASRNFSSIGGNVAENAGGLRAVKYGVTKDYVKELEVVFPDGSIVTTGSKTVKNVAGYDLTSLLIGSEGTLGIITSVTLSILPLPGSYKTFLLKFKSAEEAISIVPQLLLFESTPSTIEFIDRYSLDAVEKFTGVNYSNGAGGIILLENIGNKGEIDYWGEQMRELFVKEKVDFLEAANDKEREDLWKVRRSISASLSQIRPNRFNEDVVVKRSDLTKLIDFSYKTANRKNVLVADFGHAGDGNIHVNMMYDKKDKIETKRAWEATEEVAQYVIDLDGTVSGEHGIGITKKDLLKLQLAPAEAEKMMAIKKTFDPYGILNPGKIF